MTRMKKGSLVCLIFFVTTAKLVQAKGSGAASGGTLSQPVSARVSAFSEACAALGGSLDSFNCNPAGIHSLDAGEVSLFYKRGPTGDSFASLQSGKPVRFGVIGASFRYFDTGKIEMIDSTGNPISRTGKRDLVLSAGLAKNLGRFPVGINVKSISSEIFGEKASAWAVDVGGQSRVFNGLTAGLSAQNLGPGMKFIDEESRLPRVFTAGLSYKTSEKPSAPLFLGDMAYYPIEKRSVGRVGAETSYSDLVFFRAGYSADLSAGSGNALSLGFGFHLKGYRIDYAVELLGELNAPQKFSLSYKF